MWTSQASPTKRRGPTTSPQVQRTREARNCVGERAAGSNVSGVARAWGIATGVRFDCDRKLKKLAKLASVILRNAKPEPVLLQGLSNNPLARPSSNWVKVSAFSRYSLRSGHKEGALERAYEQMGGALIPVRVRRAVNVSSDTRFCIEPPVKDKRSRVSLYQLVMSWWLSPFTQRVLDAQLCDKQNVSGLARVLDHLDRTRPLPLPVAQ